MLALSDFRTKAKGLPDLLTYAGLIDPDIILQKDGSFLLTDWAYMALMESRIMLESELSEEKQIYISTGLGGKGRKLRFYLLLQTNENKPFLDYQRNVICHV